MKTERMERENSLCNYCVFFFRMFLLCVDRFFLFENRITGIVVEGDENLCQPSPATITPYQRLNNALQTDPRCAQEVSKFPIVMTKFPLAIEFCFFLL